VALRFYPGGIVRLLRVGTFRRGVAVHSVRRGVVFAISQARLSLLFVVMTLPVRLFSAGMFAFMLGIYLFLPAGILFVLVMPFRRAVAEHCDAATILMVPFERLQNIIL